jgi:DNA invertase Pin-like site-specific DNA recombinase
MGTIAEQERLTIKQRQAEGIAAAKTKGKKFGRLAMKKPENFDAVYASWRNGEITARKATEMLGMKTSSFYKLVRVVEHRQVMASFHISRRDCSNWDKSTDGDL